MVDDPQEPSDPVTALQDLSPLVAALRGLQRHCRLFGAGLDEMALHFTDQPSFYGAASDTVGPVMRWRGLD